jgi:hypothetical protein
MVCLNQMTGSSGPNPRSRFSGILGFTVAVHAGVSRTIASKAKTGRGTWASISGSSNE